MRFGGAKRDRREGPERLFCEALAEAGSDVHLLVRADDLFPVYVSGNFERIFLMSPERIEDDIEALNRLIDQETLFSMRRAADAWGKTGPLVFEFPYTPDGTAERRSARCSVCPVIDGTHYLVTFASTTEERKQLEQLERQMEGLSNDAQIKADFLNRMSHEIRTPLNGIIGMLSLARTRIDSPDELAEDLDKVDELGAYLLSLVNDILDMSRIESGKVELERKTFDIAALADELRSMFEGPAAERGVSYAVELQECEDRYVVGDRVRLMQVVANLVSNAVKFTERGGFVTVLLKEMYRAGDVARLMVRVRDTGKGMDPQFLGRMFRPFEQEDSSIAGRYGGSGLGMAIADSLVKLMGGEIVVESQLGIGTDFAVYLPFAVSDESALDGAERASFSESAAARASLQPLAPSSHGAASGEGAPDAATLHGMRFLMAEDNDVNARITEGLLRKRGADVERAADGAEAVRLFASREPGYFDAVLMDIKMPVMDGWTAARRIRGLDRPDADRIVIVALSANAYVEDERRSRELGLNGHLGKPIDFDELEALLQRDLATSLEHGKARA